MTSSSCSRIAAAVACTLLAGTAAAQAPSATITTPIDPDGSYAGAFGPAAVGVPQFAQTFQRPGTGFDLLRQFTINLGDNATDGSGAALSFQAAVYTVTGNQLGTQLFLSGVRAGSANSNPGPSGFDAYTFTTSGLRLDPSVGTFAILLRAIASQNGAANVIATSAIDYGGGSLFTVDGTGQLTRVNGVEDDAAFTAVFDASPSAVPEPGTVLLVASGLASVVAVARRRRAR